MKRLFNHMTLKTFSSMALLSLGACAALLMGLGSEAVAQSKYGIGSFYNSSREQSVVTAMKLLGESSGAQSLDVILNKQVKILFKDMKQLDKRLKDYDAISYLGFNGQLVIYINQKHAVAPVEALAAIIAHEAMHNDAHNSVSEEVAGWTREAQVWRDMKRINPDLNHIPEGKFSLVDRLNKIEAEFMTGNLAQFVRTRPGYQGLPESSPGFSDTMAAKD